MRGAKLRIDVAIDSVLAEVDGANDERWTPLQRSAAREVLAAARAMLMAEFCDVTAAPAPVSPNRDDR